MQPSSAHDMKLTIKKWYNRLPVISDDLSHWNDIFTFRQHIYEKFSTCADEEPIKRLGVHANAQSIIHLAKIARKHNLFDICQEMLSKVFTITSVPVVDCFNVSIYTRFFYYYY